MSDRGASPQADTHSASGDSFAQSSALLHGVVHTPHTQASPPGQLSVHPSKKCVSLFPPPAVESGCFLPHPTAPCASR
jgi:hypothetical protein